MAKERQGRVAKRATKKYESLKEFATDYEQNISKNSIQLVAGTYRGELANSIKLDIEIPDFGRIGPIEAQVIFRSPDGMTALQFVEMPPELQQAYEKAQSAGLEEVQPFLQQGLVILTTDHEAKMEALREELMAQFEAEKAELQKKFEDELERIQEEHEARIALLSSEIAEQQLETSVVVDETPIDVVRGYRLPELNQLEVVKKGKFEDLPRVLFDIGLDKTSGILEMFGGDIERYAFVHEGQLVAWKTEIKEESLGSLLINSKQLSKEDQKRCEELMEKKGIRLGEAAIQLGIFSEKQIKTFLKKQNELVTSQAIRHQQSEFVFYMMNPLPENYLAEPNSLLQEAYSFSFAISEKKGARVIFTEFAPSLQETLIMTPLGKALLIQFPLNEVQREFLQSIAPSKLALKDALALPNVERTEKAILLQTLIQLEILSFHKTSQKNEDSKVSQDVLGWLDQMEMIIEKRSHFEVLGLHWICTNQEIEQGFQKQKQMIEGLQQKVDRETKIRLDEIEKAIQQSFSILHTVAGRQEYRRQIFQLNEIEQAAQELAKRGRKMLSKGEKISAMAAFMKAMELMPENKEYRNMLVSVHKK